MRALKCYNLPRWVAGIVYCLMTVVWRDWLNDESGTILEVFRLILNIFLGLCGKYGADGQVRSSTCSPLFNGVHAQPLLVSLEIG